MSAEPSKRGRYVHRPKPLGNNDKFLDRVTLAGVKPVAVGSEDRHNPQISIVQVQHSSSRQPRDMQNPPNIIDIYELNPYIKPAPPNSKYCINCGEWRGKDRFSPDSRARDGLHSWCKMCRNEQARRIYWAAKHTAIAVAA